MMDEQVVELKALATYMKYTPSFFWGKEGSPFDNILVLGLVVKSSQLIKIKKTVHNSQK